MDKKRRKIVTGKVENFKWKERKVWKWAEDFFVLFCLLEKKNKYSSYATVAHSTQTQVPEQGDFTAGTIFKLVVTWLHIKLHAQPNGEHKL